uniref:E3 ubiquitin-protein ligase Topors n=1 Tax=Gadus morhua TaxID=8049 RepID=A0A8C5FL26_GADMO
MSASKIELRPRQKHGTNKTSGDTSKEVSPDSKCPICLDAFHNMSYLDLCLHKFCFRCIHEWSKNKAECPLCKQPFNSIYHTIKSDQDFKKYDLRPSDNGSFGSFGGVRRAVRSVEDGGRCRDTTAEFYQRNPACLHRLVPWLKRELMVLYGAHGSLELRPFLQARTEHFLHEFISFAKAPFNMEAYDQHAVYDCPDSLLDDDSSSHSSVIAVSEDDLMSVDLDTIGESMSSGALSQSAWDDETPGPSYSTTEERNKVPPLSIPDSDSSQEEELQEISSSSHPKGPSNPKDASHSGVQKYRSLLSSYDYDVGGDEDDCVIVGFVKPVSQRTPELVQLSSDSEDSVHEEMDRKPQLPQHIRFTTPSASPLPAVERSPPPASGAKPHSPSEEQSGLSRSRGHNLSERKRDYDKDSKRRRSAERCRERQGSSSGTQSRRNRRDRRSRSASDSSRSPTNSAVTLSRSRRHSRSSSSRECPRSKRDSKEKRRDGLPGSYQWQSYSKYGHDRDNSWIHYSEKTTYYSRGHRNGESRSESRSREPHDSGHRDEFPTGTYSTGSRSPSFRKRSSQDKPGGKRKYKTRHLDEPDRGSDLRSGSEAVDTTSSRTSSRKQKRSKERPAKRDATLGGETDDVGNGSDQGRRHHKKKKKHKKKSKKHKSKERPGKNSPTVITIESDSGHSTYSNVDPSGKENLPIATGMPPDTDVTSRDGDVSKSDSMPADNVLYQQ